MANPTIPAGMAFFVASGGSCLSWSSAILIPSKGKEILQFVSHLCGALGTLCWPSF